MMWRAVAWVAVMAACATADAQWARHIVDSGSRGADGARLADLNGDGLPDIVTGWEQGGEIRVAVNPGAAKVKNRWPVVRVGHVSDPEDAVLVDLDGDGALDVVSCCEGRTRTVFVHRLEALGADQAPRAHAELHLLLDESAWTTEPLKASVDQAMWMYCVPAQVDGAWGPDLICGAKGEGAQIGWFQAPADPTRLDRWTWHALRPAGWIMSIVWGDMDGDGDCDILFSDRKGNRSGVYWLQNPGPGPALMRPWKEHAVGALDKEAMFLAQGDVDQDGLIDIVVAVKPRELVWLKRLDKSGTRWRSHSIAMPEQAGRAKGVGIADIDGNGRMDLVFSCEGAGGGAGRPGVMWLSYRTAPTDPVWEAHNISGPVGAKYDLVELLDMDGDGDLDVLSTEEIELNAVVWYENPTASAK